LGVAAAFLAGLAGLGGCRDVEGGAVSFRWFLVSRLSGRRFDPVLNGGTDGACCPDRNCEGRPAWIVSRVRLVVRDTETDLPVALPPEQTTFRCDQREAITPFSIPPGIQALSLRALLPGDGMAIPDVDQAATPPPIVREVRRGVVVDLEFIDIAVEPLPVPAPAP
jgi:hypothetical protein